MSTKSIAPFIRKSPGYYVAYPLSMCPIYVWREGEGPDAGKWFYAMNAGFSDASDPCKTMREAMICILNVRKSYI